MSKDLAPAEKFARRNALFQWRRPSETAAWIATGLGVAAVITYILLAEVAHWPTWAAIAAGAVVWVAGHVAAGMWPRPIPPQFDRTGIARLEQAGWRVPRRHPFLCTEKDPHMHLVAPGGRGILMAWRGERAPAAAEPGTYTRIIPSDGSEPYWEGEPPPGWE